jgi:hypothetical protein
MNEGYIVITDAKGNTHPVTAVKPKSSAPADWYLLTIIHMASSVHTPYVVHTLNLHDGGCHDGEYCEDLNAALCVFNRR